MKNKDVYKKLTEKIIDALERDLVPWQHGWQKLGRDFPRNAHSGKAYNGFNILITMFVAMDNGYQSNLWLTFKQAKDLKGFVKAGEKSTPIAFWKTTIKKEVDADGETKENKLWLCRYYNIFNIDQIEWPEGRPEKIEKYFADAEADFLIDPETVEDIIVPDLEVKYGGDRAAYYPTNDWIKMPHKGDFKTAVHYFSTMAHECAHATGHKSQLSRSLNGNFLTDEYSKEELIAEIATTFVAGALGIEIPFDNSAAYIKGWLQKLSDDPGIIVSAAGKASKAADYILKNWIDQSYKNTPVSL